MIYNKLYRKSTNGPEWNRTTTYGFGGHRPIHWTTGPMRLRWDGMRNGPCEAWQGKDFNFSMSDAVPGRPERGGLGGVGDDFHKQRLFAGLEFVEIIDRADAEMVHAPERGEAG